MSNVFQFSDDEFEQIRAANRLLREFARSGAVQQWLETQRQLQSAFQPLMEMQQQIAAHFTSFAPLFQSAAQLSAITRSVIIPQQSLQDLLTAIPKLTTPEAEAIVQPQLAAIEEEIGEEADEEEIIAFYASEQGERQLARVVSAIAALASDTMEPWMLVLLSFAVLSAILTGTGLPGVASFLLNAAAGSIISTGSKHLRSRRIAMPSRPNHQPPLSAGRAACPLGAEIARVRYLTAPSGRGRPGIP